MTPFTGVKMTSFSQHRINDEPVQRLHFRYRRKCMQRQIIKNNGIPAMFLCNMH